MEVEVDWTGLSREVSLRKRAGRDGIWWGRHVTRPDYLLAFDVILSLVCPGMPVLCLSGSCYGDWEARWGLGL